MTRVRRIFSIASVLSAAVAFSLLAFAQPSTTPQGEGDAAPSAFPDPSQLEEIKPKFAEASSVLKPQIGGAPDMFAPRKAIDGDWTTCWSEAAQGNGTGEWIKVVWLTHELPSYVAVLPGWAKNKTRWENNPRIKTAEIVLPDGYRQIAHFDDKMQTQMIALKSGRPADWLKIVIQDVYPGKKFEDASIGEIKIYKNKQNNP